MSERASARGYFVALLHKPLVHFLGLGALLFSIRVAVAEPDSSARTIHITPAIRAELDRQLEAELGREATRQEYRAALERYKLDEVAYREALRLKLNVDDPVVRRQLISKFFEVSLRLQPLPEPTRSQLDAWFKAHRDDYVPKLRYDFEHVFAKGRDSAAEARARQFAKALQSGGDPRDMGDRFHFGPTFLGRSRDSIETEFGAEFANGISRLKPGQWSVLESKHGWHAVRLNRRSGGQPPKRAQLDRVLYRDFREHARRQLFQRQMDEIERSYRFVEQSQ